MEESGSVRAELQRGPRSRHDRGDRGGGAGVPGCGWQIGRVTRTTTGWCLTLVGPAAAVRDAAFAAAAEAVRRIDLTRHLGRASSPGSRGRGAVRAAGHDPDGAVHPHRA